MIIVKNQNYAQKLSRNIKNQNFYKVICLDSVLTEGDESLCLGFKLTEEVALRWVKNPKSFYCCITSSSFRQQHLHCSVPTTPFRLPPSLHCRRGYSSVASIAFVQSRSFVMVYFYVLGHFWFCFLHFCMFSGFQS